MNAGTADNAGTLKLKMLVMENIKEFPRGINSDQAISEATGTPTQQSVRPGPGQQHQASSSKQQPSSVKLKEIQASSGKHQAPSTKRQA